MDDKTRNDKREKRLKYILSRQALLHDIEKEEKALLSSIQSLNKNDPEYQKDLIKEYITFQAELGRIEKKNPEPFQTKSFDSASHSDNHAVTLHLKQVFDNFHKFLLKSGFVSA